MSQFLKYSAAGIPTYASIAVFPPSAQNGSLAVALDTDTLYLYDGSSQTWNAIGGSTTVLSVGPLDSEPKSDNGAVITGNDLVMQTASATKPGLVGTGIQSFAGNKTFTGTIGASNLSGTNTGDVSLAAVGSSPSANGASLSGQVLTLQPADGTRPGLLTAGAQSIGGAKTFTGAISASNLSGTNTGDVTIGTASGLSLAGQALSLGLASAGVTGALSGTDWSTFNGKQAAGNYITALTGDATASGPGSAALTLATVNSNVGSFGSASSVSAITVNAKGLVTAAASTSIQIAESQVTNLVSDLAGKQAVGNYITALTGDVAASGPGSVSATIQANVVSNSKLAQMSAHTFKGNNTGSTANAADLTATQATAELNNFVGDSGSGGTKGLVPAPSAGDAAANKFLKADGSWATTPAASFTAPLITRYTSGSGTHSKTGSPLYMTVELVGAGGGGAGSGTANGGGNGGAGGNTTFDVLTAAGGQGGSQSAATGGAGGAPTTGLGTVIAAFTGGAGQGGSASSALNILPVGGNGGSSPFGSAGAGAYQGGSSADTNSGSGGGGSSGVNQTNSGGGGGAGAYIKVMIASPGASYAYGIGAAGTAGAAGTLGFIGGTGGSGLIIVTEYYQ